jgi:hypothetical protein
MEDHLTVKITYIVTKIKLMCPAAVSLTIMSVLKNSDLKDKELWSQEVAYAFDTAMHDLSFKMADYFQIDFTSLQHRV